MHKYDISLGSIALEVNRWSSRNPSYSVSGWIPKIKAAGFDGLELWENHVLLAEGEAEKIAASGFPVSVYNHYGLFTNDKEEIAKRDMAVKMIKTLGTKAVKYNIGNNPELLAEYKENVLAFASALPEDCVLLCENHAGTLLETDDAIESFFDGLCPHRFALVIHPFGEPEELRQRFIRFGERIAHIHSQLSRGDERIRLDRWPERVMACFDIMKEYGFSGGFTVEFTELTSAPGENIEDLFTNAVLDLEFIRRCFS